jgi:3-deoxy-manno-octulosonate cytidylyltransferase (CMP-KDO synthetase)
MSDVLILIPARYQSSRFPGKPLAPIFDKPMIAYTVENCIKTGFDYAVVTDDAKIETVLKQKNYHVVRIDDDVSTGSERIALAVQRYFADKNYDYIVNVQGDEPLLPAADIQALVHFHKKNDFSLTTLVKARVADDQEIANPNIVKCAFSVANGRCLYFSRSAIPFDREVKQNWWQHIGVYSYKKEALLKFVTLPESSLEKREKLEQLRALEAGWTIGAVETKMNLIGVDTPADIKKVEGVLSGKEI